MAKKSKPEDGSKGPKSSGKRSTKRTTKQTKKASKRKASKKSPQRTKGRGRVPRRKDEEYNTQGFKAGGADMAAADQKREAEQSRKPGRPTKYTKALGQEICQRIADGESVPQICRDDHMPAASTVMLWVYGGAGNPIEAFSVQYHHSVEIRTELYMEQQFDIADNASNDWMITENQKGRIQLVPNREHIARSKLRIAVRNQHAGQMKPKKYGDTRRIEMEHSGRIDTQQDINLSAELLANLDEREQDD